jgi:diguanylate cyclase (GGDEF)-like protein
MNFEGCEDNIRELIDQVLKLRVEFPEETKNICKKLIRHGNMEGDSTLLGFAYYYLAEACFDCNEYDEFNQNLILGLEHQLEVPLVSLIAKSYNMLGINADNQGNVSAAIDYYLTSLKYSRDHDLSYEAGLVNSNIGQVYKQLKDYKSAISYLEKALLYLDADQSDNIGNRIITETTIATCYLHMGEMETAFKWFNRIERQRNRYLEETHYPFVIYCFEIQFYDQMEEYAKRDERIDKMIQILLELPTLLDVYDEAFQLCEFLMKTSRYEELWRVLERIEILTVKAGITHMQLRVLKYKLKYFTLCQKDDEYRQACADYVALTEQLEQDNRTNARRAIELRVDLEYVTEKQRLMQEENKRLLEKSQRDPLTKLPNREKLNEYSEIAFEKAFRDGTSLGVEVFDIDHFKLYNDTYGHQAGDKCLKKIAQLLHALSEQGIFCARYGGDEFIIIYENMTDEAILEIAARLKQQVMDLNLKLQNTENDQIITISQGIRNSVPQEGNKIWDYFYVADMSMYHVKRTRKNDILLLHNTREQRLFDGVENDNGINVDIH